MKLSNDQIQEILKNPINGKFIQEGRSYESKLRLFTETKFKNELESESAWQDFKKSLQKILSLKKYEKILNFINYPLSVVDITESCLNDLYKVFEARNSFFHNDYSNADNSISINSYLTENDVLNWIIEHGKKVIKNKPNSILVVDKDIDGNPYNILVDSDRLYDFQLKPNQKDLEYIIFIHSVEKDLIRYSVYDDNFYRVYIKKDGNFYLEEGKETKHTAGYCPARMFLTDKLNENNPYNRKNPFSNVIAKMNEWQVFDIYKYYADHYASFPIIEAPQSSCGIDNCKNGFVQTEDIYLEDNQTKTRTLTNPCPICSAKEIVGPGTVIKIKPKQDKDDTSENGIFRFISNPTENLNYIKDKLNDIETKIFQNVVGKKVNVSNKTEALNEVQVQSSYDEKQNILIDLKSNFDEIYKWNIITIGKLINPTVSISVSANFGTEFYLLTESDLQSIFEKAEKIGLPESEIDMIYNQLIETKYKGNNQKISRLKLIKKIDPFPYKKNDNVLNLFEKGIISKKELILKINLNRFIERFELENGSIALFGDKIDEEKKVNKILEILNKYIDEQQQKSSESK